MKIKDHYLENAIREDTPNLYSPPNFKDADLPDSVVIHYTAMYSAKGAVNVLTNKLNKASAHLVIGRDGTIYQLAPFNYRTWHAGVSSYNGRSGYNHYSIGIEIDNLGWLDRINNSFTRTELLNQGITVKDDEVIEAEHKNPRVRKKYWHKYTQKQIDLVVEICQLLKDTYDIKEIVGHDDIAGDRKQDPGPAFPMDYLIKKVLYNDRQESDEEELTNTYESFVTASKLNIRIGPDNNAAKVAMPLPRDTKVKVVDKSGAWLKVTTEVEGWVYSKYIN